jgi:ABC-type ATPase involved in cell division
MDNIALIADSLQYFTKASAASYVKERLSMVDLADKAVTHHTQLSDKEYFLVQMVRASIIEGKSLVIDSPFLMVSSEKSIAFLSPILAALEIGCEDVLIVDLSSQVSKYEEELCHIEEC